MKKLWILAVIVCASGALAQDAKSALITESGNAFLATCENHETAPALCTVYVGGVIDGRFSTDKPGFCLPETISYGQELRVTIKYMQDHPEALHVRTMWLVILAHAEAFPCPKK